MTDPAPSALGRRLRSILVLLIGGWPLLLGGAWAMRVSHVGEGWGALVYLAASRICHQRPERSFHTAGAPWPVCARCAGLYLAAPLGAGLALAGTRRRAGRPSNADDGARLGARAVLVAAALPTVLTLGLEWSGSVPVTSLARAVAAVPLGAVIAWVLVETLPGPAPRGPQAIR